MKVQPYPDSIVTAEHYHPTVIDRHGDMQPGPEIFGAHWDDGEYGLRCPYGAPGDLLWVREIFCAHWGGPPRDAPLSYRLLNGDELPPIKQGSGDLYQPTASDIMTVWYGAEGNMPSHMSWRPSIHMPRWASRITLSITDVRVERLQDISEADARAEGCEPVGWIDETDVGMSSYREGFSRLWNRINGAGAWEANPWVWALSFEMVKP